MSPALGVPLERNGFAAFYAAVNGGHQPFAWQERLLDFLLTQHRWPGQITAPTGAGKTSAIDVHVFAVALTAGSAGPRLPRRLAMVVGRRVLVDDQHVRAVELAKSLKEALGGGPGEGLVPQVAQRLAALRWPDGRVPSEGESPLVVGRLRGGTSPSRSWRDHPTACAVICATPDMWGSRLLFQGYATSDLAAPREAGMLAFDSVVLVDEAHLAGQLLVTARRVSGLAGVAESPITGAPGLQVVETTATPLGPSLGEAGNVPDSVGVDPGDLAEPVLADRLTRPKPVTLLPLPDWPAPRPGKVVVEAIGQAVLGHLREPAGEGTTATVGCYVNSVSMAVGVADWLRKPKTSRRNLNVVLVCGQTRPADIERLREAYPGILTPQGNPNVEVIVTTQSLEVGVDLDLAGVVTELASGSALAQRAGRVNRRGLRSNGPVTVIVPNDPMDDKSRSGPYQRDELDNALTWVTERSADPHGLSPWALRDHRPPAAAPRRTLYQRPELADAWHWARTSDDLAAVPELDLWLSESFEEETSIGIVVRDRLPQDEAGAIEFVRDLPPMPREVFPVPYRTAQSVLGETGRERPLMVRVRGEEFTVLGVPEEGRIATRPGDLVVIDSSAQIFSGGDAKGFSPQVVISVAKEDSDGVQATHRHPADDVLHLGANRPGQVLLRLEVSDDAGTSVGDLKGEALAAQLKEFDEQDREGLTAQARRDGAMDILEKLLANPEACSPRAAARVRAAVELLDGRVKDSDVVIRRADGGDGGLIRIIVRDRRRLGADDELHQVFSPRDPEAGPIILAEHQGAVATRAELIGRAVGLTGDLVEALRLAGQHHDDGKADPRFQVRLGAENEPQCWAKSSPKDSTKDVREREARTSLPARWRHEQRSVVDSWESLGGADDRHLVARLVGTSHGRGRSAFPHASEELLLGSAPELLRRRAAHLFDDGGWDTLIEQTQTRYGVWGCAYLEALLRAADIQVSKEGS
jgi:CRISPR-associated endonuclease/helicase Cas3